MRNKTMCGLTLLLAAQAFARDEYSRTFDKTAALASGQGVRVEHRMGNVNLRTHAGRDVVVHASIRVSASNEAEAKRVAEQIRIEVAPAGSALVIRTAYPKEERDGFFGFHNLSYSVNLEITMPETAPLELRNSFGSVSIEDLKANSDVTNANGKLTFRNGRGTQRLENQFGAVEVTGNVGDVEIRNGNGSVDVSEVTGMVNVKNRFANVTVANPGRGGTIVNGNGSVEVTGAGGDVRITNSFGKVTVSGVKGNLVVGNANGEVEANRVTGSAELNTSSFRRSASRPPLRRRALRRYRQAAVGARGKFRRDWPEGGRVRDHRELLRPCGYQRRAQRDSDRGRQQPHHGG